MNERILRRLWLGGAWPRGLPRDADGTPLQVVFPGRSGHGAGPDLLDAIVGLPDGRLLQGDVELHVRGSDWSAHGHDGDARYGRVVLHVVWRDDLGPAPAAGRPVMRTVALGALPEALLFERLRAPAPAEQPYHRWLGQLPPERLAGLVEELGDERLEARSLRLASDLHALGPAEALHRAVGEALGYAQNRAAFAALAEVAPASELAGLAAGGGSDAVEVVTAHLFARAGLLDDGPVGRIADRPGGRWPSATARSSASRRATGSRRAPGRRSGCGRPTGQPAGWPRWRRWSRGPDRAGSSRRWSTRWRRARRQPALRRLGRLIRVGPGDDYWSWHHDFGRRLPGAPMAPLGDARAGAIMANALLPFALALADAQCLSRSRRWPALGLADRARGRPNWITVEMRPLLGGMALTGARREQGAIELYRRCCEERRCATCPAASLACRGGR